MLKRSVATFIAAVYLVAGISLWAQQPALVPAASTKEAELRLLAGQHEPVVLKLTDLKTMPHLTVKIHNSHSNADETYSGVRVSDLLAKVGAPLGSSLRGKALAQYIVASGSDGYQTVLWRRLIRTSIPATCWSLTQWTEKHWTRIRDR